MLFYASDPPKLLQNHQHYCKTNGTIAFAIGALVASGVQTLYLHLCMRARIRTMWQILASEAAATPDKY